MIQQTTALRKICGVYKITSPNGRIYIGQSVDIKRRIRSYKNLGAKSQPRLHKSFIKYGVVNHIFEIIEECSIDCLNDRERYWQEYYQCNISGLNCSLVSTVDKKYVHSEYSKNKISNTRTGIIFSEEHKENIRRARTGTSLSDDTKKKLSDINKKQGKRPPSWKGKVKTSQHLKNISDRLKGRLLTDAQKSRVSENMKNAFMPYSFIILDVDSGVFYNSVSQLSDLLKCNKSNLLKKINKGVHPKYIKA